VPELSVASRALTAPLLQQLAVYSAFAMTIGIALGGPRIGRVRVPGPGVAAALAVAALMVVGVLSPADVTRTASILWRAIVTISSIMVLSSAAQRLGVLDWLATLVAGRHAGRSAFSLYARVFALAMLSAAVLNNDTTILLVTPLVIGLVSQRYPTRPDLVLPFAFAVFMAAGVAPFMVSNPMNMVVATAVGIGFNEYAVAMIPVAVTSWLVSFLVLCAVFAGQLASAPEPVEKPGAPARPTPAQIQILVLLLFVLGAYPLVASLDGPVWAVALLGEGVAWGTLAFLVGVFLLGVAMQNVGVVGRLAVLYEGAGPFVIGGVAAVASALMNNHPTAIMNALALGAENADKLDILAALVGGDLGPRLLPTGSLAGLMWVALLRTHGVAITPLQFLRVGVVVLVPSLVAALAVLRMP
jgi:arsenical pump membrane protein